MNVKEKKSKPQQWSYFSCLTDESIPPPSIFFFLSLSLKESKGKSHFPKDLLIASGMFQHQSCPSLCYSSWLWINSDWEDNVSLFICFSYSFALFLAVAEIFSD